MVESISKMRCQGHPDFMQGLKVEQDPGWHICSSINEINGLLEGQKPFTYIISPLAPDTYLLSFIREEDQSVVHVQFDKLKNGHWHYLNGRDNIVPTLKELIRKIMHLSDAMPGPTPSAR